MGKKVRTPPLKQFRKRVEHHIKEIEDSVDFPTDSEWIALILSKLRNYQMTRSTLINSHF